MSKFVDFEATEDGAHPKKKQRMEETQLLIETSSESDATETVDSDFSTDEEEEEVVPKVSVIELKIIELIQAQEACTAMVERIYENSNAANRHFKEETKKIAELLEAVKEIKKLVQ